MIIKQLKRSSKLNFTKNLIEIIENVHYMSDNTNIYADKVELDLLRKMKISMNNQMIIFRLQENTNCNIIKNFG